MLISVSWWSPVLATEAFVILFLHWEIFTTVGKCPATSSSPKFMCQTQHCIGHIQIWTFLTLWCISFAYKINEFWMMLYFKKLAYHCLVQNLWVFKTSAVGYVWWIGSAGPLSSTLTLHIIIQLLSQQRTVLSLDFNRHCILLWDGLSFWRHNFTGEFCLFVCFPTVNLWKMWTLVNISSQECPGNSSLLNWDKEVTG